MSYRDEFRDAERASWWTLPRAVALIAALVVGLFAVAFVANGLDLATYRFWAPKQAAAERKVFEETPSYVQGKATYIGKLCRDAAATTGPQRKALLDEVLTEAATVNNSNLPTQVQGCIAQAQGGF